MKITKQMSSVIVRALLIVALVFGLAPAAQAQTLAAKGKPAPARAKSPTTAKPSGGTQEGIKVHGHWTIEVRNPDGRLVSRHEFENSLFATGDQLLAGLLGRRIVSVAQWRVKLQGTNLGDITGPCRQSGQPRACIITEGTQAGSPFFGGLSVNVPPAAPGTFELAGQASADAPDSIASVATDATVCLDQSCTSTQALFFTKHVLAAPIQLTTGQIAQVKVVFSFS